MRKGVSFLQLLQLAFIVLKLCNVIDWGWEYVMMPLIFYVAGVIVIYAFGGDNQ